MERKELLQTKLKFSFFILVIFFISNCQNEIENNNPNLNIRQGKLFYKDEPFSGIVKQEIEAVAEIHKVEYKNGIEDGDSFVYQKNGDLLEKRQYIQGEKHGIHRGWYKNGKNKTYSEFDMGKYINEKWEWYDHGLPAGFEKYSLEGKILVTKKWYRNGHIYMNIAFAKDGRSLGLPGSKLCDPIKKEKNKTL